MHGSVCYGLVSAISIANPSSISIPCSYFTLFFFLFVFPFSSPFSVGFVTQLLLITAVPAAQEAAPHWPQRAMELDKGLFLGNQ